MSAKNQPIKRESAPPSTRKPMLTAGRVLKARRNEIGLSLQQISDEIKIKREYLENIEKDDFDSFESKVFLNGFIKNYADFLGLDVDKVTALYRRSIDEDLKKPFLKTQQKQEKKAFNFDIKSLITPTNIIIVIVFAFIVGLISYISVQFYNFNKSPLLTIYTPETTSTTADDKISITGITESDVLLFINDSEINVNEDNTFETEVSLVKGSNTVTVKAVKKGNAQSESITILDITYQPTEETKQAEEAVEEISETYEATLTISGSEAWIQFNVDGSQKVAQVVAAGYSETFTVEEELTLLTGRPTTTKLSINGTPVEITSNPTTGTATVTCVIGSTGFTCN